MNFQLSINVDTDCPHNTLQELLQDHPDTKCMQYLLSGLKWAFIQVFLFYLPFDFKNLLPATKEPLEVAKLLASEPHKRYIIGPFKNPSFSKFQDKSSWYCNKKIPKKSNA